MFNSLHLFEAEDAMAHIETCPDRIPHEDLFFWLTQKQFYKQEIADHVGSEASSTFQPLKMDSNDETSGKNVISFFMSFN